MKYQSVYVQYTTRRREDNLWWRIALGPSASHLSSRRCHRTRTVPSGRHHNNTPPSLPPRVFWSIFSYSTNTATLFFSIFVCFLLNSSQLYFPFHVYVCEAVFCWFLKKSPPNLSRALAAWNAVGVLRSNYIPEKKRKKTDKAQTTTRQPAVPPVGYDTLLSSVPQRLVMHTVYFIELISEE